MTQASAYIPIEEDTRKKLKLLKRELSYDAFINILVSGRNWDTAINVRNPLILIRWLISVECASGITGIKDMFEVHCNFCSGNFILDKQPDANWSCICRNKPKPWSILHHCSNGHKTWIKNMNGECEECSKQKTIKTAKKLLAMQSDPKRIALEQSIVKTDQIIRQKKEDFIKNSKLL